MMLERLSLLQFQSGIPEMHVCLDLALSRSCTTELGRTLHLQHAQLQFADPAGLAYLGFRAYFCLCIYKTLVVVT